MPPAESMAARVRAEIRPGVWLDSALALFFEAEETLVLSDIHWGYAAVHRQQGNLFPFWGDAKIAEHLDELLEVYRPRRMIWLGDSLHGITGRTAADAYLDSLPAALESILIGGNHDRKWSRGTRQNFQSGNYLFHHGDQSAEVAPGICEVVGHWHPAFTHRDGAGLSLKLPVLVEQPFRLVLPAFSPWSKGTDWTAGPEDQIWMIAPKRIWKGRPPGRSLP